MKENYMLQNRIRGVSKEIIKEIEYYPYLDSLLDELSKKGYWQRMEKVPQLGMIRVKSEFLKKRKTYVMMQLYLHDFCRRNLKMETEYSYNSYLSASDLNLKKEIVLNGKRPTIADAEQALVIFCNIGHFLNTFMSSRAMLSYLGKNPSTAESFISLFDDYKIREMAQRILVDDDYHHFHLLNSYLMLSECDQSIPSVHFALSLTKKYLTRSIDKTNQKLQMVFNLFEAMRDLTIITYDLQVARIPFYMDIWNDGDLKRFLIERISSFQDNSAAKDFMSTSLKLLRNTLYCPNAQVLKEYQIAKKLAKRIPKDYTFQRDSYLQTFLLSDGFGLNAKITSTSSFGSKKLPWLKITLNANTDLAAKLDKIEYVEAGYYDRKNGRTFIAQIKESCPNRAKTALSVIRAIIPHIPKEVEKATEINKERNRALLQLFLFLMDELFNNKIRIDETVTSGKQYVLGDRGCRKRWELLHNILLKSNTNDQDKKHEVEFMLDFLKEDHKNDYAIMVPASIKVKESASQIDLCEFDGIIVFPYRKEGQVIFLEAKNMSSRGYAEKCIKDKFRKTGLIIDEKHISHFKDSQDVSYTMTI